jgi:hypothetical protein
VSGSDLLEDDVISRLIAPINVDERKAGVRSAVNLRPVIARHEIKCGFDLRRRNPFVAGPLFATHSSCFHFKVFQLGAILTGTQTSCKV